MFHPGVAAALLAAVVYGQPAPSFDAASVKPLKTSEGPFHFTVLPNRLDVKNMNLKFLIKQAYNLRDDQVSGSESLVTNHYDIMATTDAPVSKETMRIMLRSLLIERFHLTTHSESRTMPLYRLVVLPSGPKMKTAEQEYAIPNSPTLDRGSMRLDGPMSMRQLAESLTRFAGKLVVDATNLDGPFTFSLTFASDDVSSPANSEFAPPLLTAAVQEQLGLKLVPAKEPVQILIVDHADAVPVSN